MLLRIISLSFISLLLIGECQAARSLLVQNQSDEEVSLLVERLAEDEHILCKQEFNLDVSSSIDVNTDNTECSALDLESEKESIKISITSWPSSMSHIMISGSIIDAASAPQIIIQNSPNVLYQPEANASSQDIEISLLQNTNTVDTENHNDQDTVVDLVAEKVEDHSSNKDSASEEDTYNAPAQQISQLELVDKIKNKNKKYSNVNFSHDIPGVDISGIQRQRMLYYNNIITDYNVIIELISPDTNAPLSKYTAYLKNLYTMRKQIIIHLESLSTLFTTISAIPNRLDIHNVEASNIQSAISGGLDHLAVIDDLICNVVVNLISSKYVHDAKTISLKSEQNKHDIEDLPIDSTKKIKVCKGFQKNIKTISNILLSIRKRVEEIKHADLKPTKNVSTYIKKISYLRNQILDNRKTIIQNGKDGGCTIVIPQGNK